MEKRKLYFLGDLHAGFKFLTHTIQVDKITNTTIVQVGDFGIGFLDNEASLLKKLNQVLVASSSNLFAIRGNHDRPSAFHNSKIESKIELIKDYTVKNIEGVNILFIGGAISIDRVQRKVGISYWRDEAFVFDKEKLNEAVAMCSRLDIVVTHSAPNAAPPKDKGNIVFAYERVDRELSSDIKDERSAHDELLNYLIRIGLKPTHWYYGHFHQSQKIMHREIEFNLLAIDELRPHNIE